MKRFTLHLIVWIALTGCNDPLRSCESTVLINDVNSIQSTIIEDNDYLLVWDNGTDVFYKSVSIYGETNPPENAGDFILEDSRKLSIGIYPRVRKISEGDYLITFLQRNRSTGKNDLYGGIYRLHSFLNSNPDLRIEGLDAPVLLLNDVGKSYDLESLEGNQFGLLLTRQGSNVEFHTLNADKLRMGEPDLTARRFNEPLSSAGFDLKFVAGTKNILVSWLTGGNVEYCFLDKVAFSRVAIEGIENPVIAETAGSYGTAAVLSKNEFLVLYKSNSNLAISRSVYKETANGIQKYAATRTFNSPEFKPQDISYVHNEFLSPYDSRAHCPQCKEERCLACTYQVNVNYKTAITKINGIAQYADSDGQYVVSMRTEILPHESYERKEVCDKFVSSFIGANENFQSLLPCAAATYEKDRPDNLKTDAFWFVYAKNSNSVSGHAKGHPGAQLSNSGFKLLSDDLTGNQLAMYGQYLQRLK